MTKQDFIKELENELGLDSPISSETCLNDLSEFDSFSVVSLVALINKTFSKQLNARQIMNATTVQTLIELIGPEAFDG